MFYRVDYLLAVMALGSSSRRLLVQLLVENLVLYGISGALGLSLLEPIDAIARLGLDDCGRGHEELFLCWESEAATPMIDVGDSAQYDRLIARQGHLTEKLQSLFSRKIACEPFDGA